MITKEGFIQATGMEPEKAEKLYENLNDRFNGDWDRASDYLKDLIKYLQTHKNYEPPPTPPILHILRSHRRRCLCDDVGKYSIHQ